LSWEGIPRAVKDKPLADDHGFLPIFVGFAPCRLVPVAASVLDCFPQTPLSIYDFVHPWADKRAS